MWYQDLTIQINDLSDDLCEMIENFLIENNIRYTAKATNQRLEGDNKQIDIMDIIKERKEMGYED